MDKKKQVDFQLDIHDLVTEDEYNSVIDDRSIHEEVFSSIDNNDKTDN